MHMLISAYQRVWRHIERRVIDIILFAINFQKCMYIYFITAGAIFGLAPHTICGGIK